MALQEEIERQRHLIDELEREIEQSIHSVLRDIKREHSLLTSTPHSAATSISEAFISPIPDPGTPNACRSEGISTMNAVSVTSPVTMPSLSALSANIPAFSQITFTSHSVSVLPQSQTTISTSNIPLSVAVPLTPLPKPVWTTQATPLTASHATQSMTPQGDHLLESIPVTCELPVTSRLTMPSPAVFSTNLPDFVHITQPNLYHPHGAVAFSASQPPIPTSFETTASVTVPPAPTPAYSLPSQTIQHGAVYTPVSGAAPPTSDSLTPLIDAMQLPKVELMPFNGNPLQYHPFMRSFENMVGHKNVPHAAKLARLLQYCRGEAYNLIQCCCVMEPENGYATALRLLKERYGDSYTISQAWIQKIMNRGPVTDNTALRHFADELRCCFETLRAVGRKEDINSGDYLLKIVQKLPQYIKPRWLKLVHSIRSEGRNPDIGDLVNFVSLAADERNDPVFGQLLSTGREGRSRQITANYSTSTDSPLCACCGSHHSLFNCEEFKGLRVQDRLTLAKQKNLCFNCLRTGHVALRCPVNRVCSVEGCKQKHTKFLHLPQRNANQNIDEMDTEEVACNATGAGVGKKKIALPIISVKVRGQGQTQFVETYALLDSGSTQSFCSEELTRSLNLESTRKNRNIVLNTLGSQRRVFSKSVNLEVTDADETLIYDMTDILTRPKLNIGTDNIVSQEELDNWQHLKDIKLPEVDIEQVHILIGQDMPELLKPREIREGKTGMPYAVRTALGWTISGPIGERSRENVSSYFVNTSNELQDQIKNLWNLDGHDEDFPAMSVNDKKVMTIWENSLHYDEEEKHYSMDIPFQEEPLNLPDNRSVANFRLQCLKRRLQKDKWLQEKYVESMVELRDKGYAEVVKEPCRDDGYVWYLPHHPVLHARKPDKVRIVYDCAAKHKGISLNDAIYQGPDLTNKLIGVLLRFRHHPVAFMADIEGMFLQVKVNEYHRDVLRFLWWKDDDMNKPVQVYRMTRHLFGGVWSPSCASFALRRTALDNSSNFTSHAIETVLRNFYVDDCLKSVPDTQHAIQLVKELRELLALGGFKLTKWISNSRELQHSIPEAEWAKGIPTLDLEQDELPVERALGVLWDVESDKLGFNTLVKRKPVTRRGLLSVVSSVYDPLGFVSPFIQKAKMLFQMLCKLKIGWDDPLPEDIAQQWNKWQNDLPLIDEMKIQRCLVPPEFGTPIDVQLHHFADASENGYGVVTYLRLTNREGHVHCAFVMSRARLAPCSATTIPRLELSAAVIAVDLDELLRRELDFSFSPSVFWSDSMIVLQYIANEDKRFKTFVANRIAKIREVTSPTQWRHISSKLNPADDVSRGLTPQELVSKEQWICGPCFLRFPESEWPSSPHLAEVEAHDIEVKQDVSVYHAEIMKADIIDKLMTRYSTWNKLKKAVAWILRAKSVLRSKVLKRVQQTCDRLSVEELNAAEEEIVKYVQRNMTREQLQSKGFKRLLPETLPSGIWVVGGRLRYSSLVETAKHQWILPQKHPIVSLIVRHYHNKAGHTGVEHVLSDIRQHYWIMNGRAAVKREIYRCMLCRKLKAPTLDQRMADLPKNRTEAFLPPFTIVGVDFFGPFFVKRARSEEKRYGCLFTCLTCRAIHIEISHSLSTDSFLNAMQRFICRRGEPAEVRSDNGTNFTGAHRELREHISRWNQNKITDCLRQREIKWVFNPPCASHMGGIWERQIRTVRSVLSSLLAQQPLKLDDEALCTLMCIVENIVNSRPITKLSDDPKDLLPLTPNHLLLLRSGPVLPPGEFVKQDMYHRRWKQVQYIADLFWQRWLKEYLPLLQERQKWLSVKRDLKVGDLVLVKDESTPRLQWPMGLVTNTSPSMDGRVRSVQVRTQHGIFKRPVTKLCLLEGVD